MDYDAAQGFDIPAAQPMPDISQGDIAPYVTKGTGSFSNPIHQAMADEFRAGGMSENGIRGIFANVNDESRFNPALRHPDQPNWGGEAHFAHGLYQEGGAEWNNYAKWLQDNGHSDWKDPRLQTRFLVQNLKANYPDVWKDMNSGSAENAAQAFVSGYLKPASQYEAARSAKYGRGVPDLTAYGGQPVNEGPLSDTDKLTAALMQSQAPKARGMDNQGIAPIASPAAALNLRPPRDTSALSAALMQNAFAPTNAPGMGTTLGKLGELFAGHMMAEKYHNQNQDYQHALGQALLSANGDPNKVMAIAAQSGNPELIKTALTSFSTPPQWGVIGKNLDGSDQYGWINPRTQTATPAHLTPSGPMAGQPAAPGQPAQAQPSQPTQPMSMQDFNNLIASGVKGPELLAKLDPLTRDSLQALLEGKAAPGNVARGTPYWQMLMRLAHHVDPAFDESVYNARAAMRKNAESGGKDYQSIESANSVFHHLHQLSEAAQKQNNFNSVGPFGLGTKLANDVRTWGREQQGDPDLSNFEAIRDLAVKEVEKFYISTGGSEGERKAAMERIKAASTPQQLDEIIAQTGHAMTGKIEEINRQWEKTMGPNVKNLNVLAPKSIETLKTLDERAAKWRKPEETAQKPAQAAETPKAKYKEGDTATAEDGRKAVFKNGKWEIQEAKK